MTDTKTETTGSVTTSTNGYYHVRPPAQVCPNCGYCPHCGRSAQPYYPLYPQPWWQQPWGGTTYWDGNSWVTLTTTAAAGNQ